MGLKAWILPVAHLRPERLWLGLTLSKLGWCGVQSSCSLDWFTTVRLVMMCMVHSGCQGMMVWQTFMCDSMSVANIMSANM